MGVFSRPDSLYWWLYLETTKRKERTDFLVGTTTSQRRDSRRLADDRYHQRMNEIAARLYKLPSAKADILFRAYAESYRSIIAHHRGREQEEERLVTLVRAFGSVRLSALDRERVQAWMATRRKSVAASTVNREVDLLKSILRDAVPKYLDTSPLVGMKKLPVLTPKRRLMSADEESELLAVATEPQIRALIINALDSLVRLSDLLDLKRTDRRDRWIFLRDPKSGEPCEVALSVRGAAALDAIPETSPYFFPRFRRAATEHGRRHSVRYRLRVLCERAGIPYGRTKDGLTFHWATRRTGATRMLMDRRVPLPAVQRQGTWKHPDVLLEIYAEANKDDLLQAVDSFPQRSRGKQKSA